MKKDYKKQMEELYQLHLQSINPIDSNKNIIVFNQTKESDYRLYLVIKDPNNISLYKDESDNKKLYTNIELPYFINNSIFSNTEDDPRYTFQENSNEEKQNYNYSCTLIPFEKLENAYRIVNIELTKQKDNKKKTKTFL